MASWHFLEHNGHDDMTQNASAEAFEGTSTKTIATDIVREGIQNVLDARVDRAQPARVRLAIGTLASRTGWFNLLSDHFRQPDVGVPDAPVEGEPCRFLVVEDFNTTGLVGDFRAKYKKGDANNFVNFFYNDAVTDKQDKNLGSRGVGKIVFLLASRVRTLFGYTFRSTDSEHKPLLVGKSLLKFRQIDEKLYAPACYFVEKWDKSSAREPVSDDKVLAQFVRDFSITRKSEPGLSIVIPYLDPAVTLADIQRAVIEEYHYAILIGALVVELVEGNRHEIVTANHIPDTADEELSARVALTKYAIANPDPSLSTLAPIAKQVQRLVDELVPEAVRTSVVAALNQHHRLGVRCPVNIHPKKGAALETSFDVYIERAEQCRDRPTFIRELLPVSGEGERLSQARALVLIRPGPLADLLRASEGANHTKWSPRTDNFKKSYEGRLGEIEFVRSFVNRLIEIARGNANEPVGGISTFYFSAFSQDAKTTMRNKGKVKPGPAPEVPDPPVVEPISVGYIFSQNSDGFSLRGDPEKPHPSRITVRVAYDVIRGSPWSDYDADDFDFRRTKGDICVIASGAELGRPDPGNRLIIKPTTDDFEVIVTGFNPNLDVIVEHRNASNPAKTRRSRADADQTSELH